MNIIDYENTIILHIINIVTYTFGGAIDKDAIEKGGKLCLDCAIVFSRDEFI